MFCELPSRGVVALGGEDRLAFLNNLVSNEVSAKTPCYALLLSPQGKFLFDFFIIPTPDDILLDCEAHRLSELVQTLTRYRLRSRVVPYDVSAYYAVLAVLAPVALEAPAAHIYADPRHAGLGQRVLVARDWLPDLKARCLAAGLAEGTPDDYQRQRINLCVPEGSADLEPGRAFPMDYGMDRLNAISFSKGCYIGQELTARMKYRGLVKKQVRRATLQAPLPAPGTPVMAGEQDAGHILSGIDQTALVLLRDEFAKHDLTCTGKAVTLQA